MALVLALALMAAEDDASAFAIVVVESFGGI